MVAGAKDKPFSVVLMWAEAHDANTPVVDPTASGLAGAQKLAQHLYASFLMSTEAGTEAHSIADNTPLENGLEAWRRLVHGIDPAQAQANLSMMSSILKLPHENLKNTTFPVEKWEEMATTPKGPSVEPPRVPQAGGPRIHGRSAWNHGAPWTLGPSRRRRTRSTTAAPQLDHFRPSPLDRAALERPARSECIGAGRHARVRDTPQTPINSHPWRWRAAAGWGQRVLISF